MDKAFHPTGRRPDAYDRRRSANIPLPAFAVRIAFHHRGPTHSLLLWGALTWLVLFFGAQQGLYCTALAASLGYLSHLAADSFTHHGEPWLWPIYRHSFGVPLLRFDTGSTSEYLAVVAVVVATTLVVQGSSLALF
jgi:inner membrane protein